MNLPAILARKLSAFSPQNLLRKARRQKGLAEACVPAVCVLDPDGDIVRHLKASDSVDIISIDLSFEAVHHRFLLIGDVHRVSLTPILPYCR